MSYIMYLLRAFVFYTLCIASVSAHFLLFSFAFTLMFKPTVDRKQSNRKQEVN